ncbi:hypothetical protein DFP72DRAFT_1076135 [Ephemerocybe angulata]|uniref:Uncharacterized protein n=1 Tax=Ephemerocybe angulata TaxID=980116 RepID=A0A8H6LZI8_9AGAR|nr:hypothetical protein DFP72DRAFT_1076135 [Tulosesus angulatus]
MVEPHLACAAGRHTRAPADAGAPEDGERTTKERDISLRGCAVSKLEHSAGRGTRAADVTFGFSLVHIPVPDVDSPPLPLLPFDLKGVLTMSDLDNAGISVAGPINAGPKTSAPAKNSILCPDCNERFHIPYFLALEHGRCISHLFNLRTSMGCGRLMGSKTCS